MLELQIVTRTILAYGLAFSILGIVTKMIQRTGGKNE